MNPKHFGSQVSLKKWCFFKLDVLVVLAIVLSVSIHRPIYGLSGPLAGGERHVLALREDGTVWAWGLNDFGQLGDGTLTSRERPVQVVMDTGEPIQGIVALAARGWQSLALGSDGTVWAWGRNDQGQLGAGSSFSHRATAAQVLQLGGGILSNVAKIECGRDFCLALREDGTVWAWGAGNDGQLGDGETEDSPVAVAVTTSLGTALQGVSSIAAGRFHAMALRSDGTVWSWGSDSKGQLGDNGDVIGNADRAVQVFRITGSSLANIRLLAAGDYFGLAADDAGMMWAWGENDFGQHGDGSTVDREKAASWSLPPSLQNLESMDAGAEHVLARTAVGLGWAWGSNDFAQLGGYPETMPFQSSSPLAVLDGASGVPLDQIAAIATTKYSSFARTEGGLILSWGLSSEGVLGRSLEPGEGSHKPLPVLDIDGEPFRLDLPIPEYDLTIMKAGGGSGVVVSVEAGIHCDTSCSSSSATLQEGTSVSVSGSAATGSTFIGFSGGTCSGSQTCNFTMSGDVSLVATFISCHPPTSGNWTVSESCNFTHQAVAPADVIVEPGVVLSIAPGAVLEIDLHNHKLLVRDTGGVLVKDGGTIRQTSGTLQP